MTTPLHPAFLSGALLLAATCLSAPAVAQDRPAAAADYFFGDSDLEQGNFQILSGRPAADFAPYFCGGGLCRDSNGPVWPERLRPGVQAALAATPGAPALNFAVSGAHMTGRGDPALAEPSGVAVQIAQFAALQDAGRLVVRPQDRFFIHAGTNDLTRLLEGDAPDLVASDIVAATVAHVSALADRGARTIVVARVQPVQYLPMLAGEELDELRSAIGDLVSDTNAALTDALLVLKPTLPTGANIILVDQEAFFRHVTENAAELGFVNTAEPCFDADTGALCSTDPAAQNRYLFFDDNHLSAAGHELLAAWYQATLDGASGAAARTAGQVPGAMLDQARRGRDQTRGARALTGDRPGLFMAPVAADMRRRSDGADALELRLRGGVIGGQLALGERGRAGLAVSRLETTAGRDAPSGFEVREWSASVFADLDIAGARVSVSADYARPEMRDFRRAVGVPGMTATGEARAERWGFGLDVTETVRVGRIQLEARSGIAYDRVRMGGFEEAGADGLALRYAAQTAGHWRLDSEVRALFAPWSAGAGLKVQPSLRVRSETRLGGGRRHVRSTLIDNLADTACLTLAREGRDQASVGAGLDLQFGRVTALGIVYERAISGPDRGDLLSLALARRF